MLHRYVTFGTVCACIQPAVLLEVSSVIAHSLDLMSVASFHSPEDVAMAERVAAAAAAAPSKAHQHPSHHPHAAGKARGARTRPRLFFEMAFDTGQFDALLRYVRGGDI